jgi:phosphoadenosine phosphosulfate reductase
LEAVKRAKRHWKNLRFYEAACHMKPEETWDEFGVPGRRIRWCCQVHKSVPTILKMREITKNYNVQTVVFDGVRAEESDSRAQYGDVSIGVKNINQINARPIYEWGTAEIYLYLLKNNLIMNSGYNKGLFRIGCKVCPMSSAWWDSIANDSFKKEIRPLLKRVENYAKTSKPEKGRKEFIEKGGWKGRMGGRYLPNGGNRYTEMIENNAVTFDFAIMKQKWLDVSPILGTIVAKRKNKYIHKIDRQEFTLIIENRGKRIRYTPYSQMNRFIISHLRGVANKVAYCIGCKACMVHCPVDAFIIDGNGNIFIREEKCIHCSKCIEFTQGKGCLVAKSLSNTGVGNMNLKGMDHYKHFGFRREWLEHFFEFGSECFSKNVLGNLQYFALKAWLKEAGLLSPANKGEKSGMPTELFEKLKPFGSYSASVWAVIWANLAYNSVITRWYMLSVSPGEVYEKNDLIFMLSDDYSQSTRDNAVTALLETFRHSPIGSALKQGIPVQVGGVWRYTKDGWETPEAAAILYSLYLYAEKTGRYTFSLKQLEEAKASPEALGVDPVSVFGLKFGEIKGILQEIALQNKEYIRVSFVKDLDTVHLTQDVASIDIISLFQ